MLLPDMKKFDIRQAMSWVEMPELGSDARILVKPATEANPQYFNAMLKLSGKRVRAMARTDVITAEDAELSRKDDRDLYPLFVISNWEGIVSDNEAGSEGVDDDGFVIYNRRVSQQLCELLPAHVMDRLRNSASTPERFYAEDEILPPDPSELAENSVSD